MSGVSRDAADNPRGQGEDSAVYTFYSYKGGVGRSMALANLAVLLAREHGHDVIVVDWDLEAPGLPRRPSFGVDLWQRGSAVLRNNT